VRLRYTGEHPKAFTEHGVGEVSKGDEFEVPAEEAERYARRDDIEFATPAQKAKATKAEAATAGELPESEDGA
jgi:hypothetical protein